MKWMMTQLSGTERPGDHPVESTTCFSLDRLQSKLVSTNESQDSELSDDEERDEEAVHIDDNGNGFKGNAQKASQSIWRNLKGTKAVVSKPDFCFYKSGLQDSLFFGDEEVVVSVIEVKQSSEKLARRLMEMNINSNQSSTSSGSSERLENSEIETDLNKRVLGQHAGELLLDLDRFRVKKTVYVDENYIMTMPGMIVDGTQVFFTLLEMARSHHRKLKYNEVLDAENDKATIYYSRPLDILVEQDRIMLVENFMRLNNI